jgi:hypothetical protein
MFPGAADLPRVQVIDAVMQATRIPDRPSAALLVPIELGESDGEVVALDEDGNPVPRPEYQIDDLAL